MTDPERKRALEDFLALKSCVVAISTGTPFGAVDYEGLRLAAQSHAQAWELMPVSIRSSRVANEIWSHAKAFTKYAERRSFWQAEFEPALSYLESGGASPSIEDSELRLGAIDVPHVAAYWRKALSRLATDPEGAVTVSRSLIESTCRHILEKAGEKYEDKGDVKALYRQVAKLLDLAPDAKAETAVKQILQGCESVVHGVSVIRSSLGDAHGKGGANAGARAIDAKLAVNLAGAMCTFLLECDEARTEDSRGDW